MNHPNFILSARDIVANYWRIKAALALFRQAPLQQTGELRYDGIPSTGALAGILSVETIDTALNALTSYSHERLARDLFIALIASFESRLSTRLTEAGIIPSGTLGNLQTAVQGLVSIPPDRIADLNEVRIRRNMLMHHGGTAQANYITAAQQVNPRAAGFVSIPTLGDIVIPDGRYLTYASDVLIGYSATL